MKELLLYLWQLPQNLCGLVLSLVLRGKIFRRMDYRDVSLYLTHKCFKGISLGRYIFADCASSVRMARPIDVAHEYGHSIQSRRWGWLYLPVVGGYSAIRAGLHLYRRGHYHDSWPENMADYLGGVRRDETGYRYV